MARMVANMRLTLFCALALLGISAGASAQEPTVLTVTAGRFDANRRKEPAAELGLQLRPTLGRGTVRPILGGMATRDGAILGHLGAALELDLGPRLVAGASIAPGYYHRGNGKELGSRLEFRSGIELAWRMRRGARVGVELYHLSNAGLGERNPGEETLAFSLSIPVRRRTRPSPQAGVVR